ncbi:TetR/AcrR family transcriptional regulator [Thermoactinospora rubra]|uniref:TetR/AcrR family transcriptional regulator n=1 Tax=Thermoactinospora rubra TaxID=1088767 RepID=UPI000A0F9103|nr:TetR/AcrR family transcriptional regulator [Thermoactinospora rubra]
MDRRRQTPEQRRARANRILDAAAELIERWGYDKTTLDDVARAAHVAKGTLYLHWKSRDELFAALLRRERVSLLEALRERMADHAESVGSLMRLMALEVLARPLLRAFMFDDREILGSLLRLKHDNPDRMADALAAVHSYLEAMREHGLLRQDLTPEEQQDVLLTALYGFFLTPPSASVGVERRADLLAETIQRTLESGSPITPQVAERVVAATTDYLDRALEIARRKLDMSL